MAERIPSTLRYGALTFNVITLGDGRLAFSYYEGSKRIVVKKSSIDDLRAEASRISTAILNAESDSLELSASDARLYVAARDLLSPLSLAIDAAARLVVEAAQILGTPARIVEAARWFAQSQRSTVSAPTADVVAHFLRNLSADGVKPEYYNPMEKDLTRFSVRFPGSIADCRAAEMEDWIRAMKLPGKEEPIGLRRRRNLRAALVTLFNFARVFEYLPQGLLTEAEKIKRPKVPRKAPAIYTPGELSVLIEQCLQPADKKSGRRDYADFLPAIVIGAFAGLRWAEILSLDWERHIHFDQGVIEVGDENKTGHRNVPIQPNLLSFLNSYADKRGPVCPYRRPDNIIRRLGMRAGLPVGGRRYANALRHSFVSYRVAVIKDIPAVSIESGHTVQELKKSYNRPQLESAGKKWFAISNTAADNVLQMSLLSFGTK